MRDSRQRCGAVVHAAEEHAVLFLSVNIRFVALVMSSKEAEPQPAGGQGLYAASPRARAAREPGEQRWLLPRDGAHAHPKTHAQIPKLLASAGAQAILDGLQKSCL